MREHVQSVAHIERLHNQRLRLPTSAVMRHRSSDPLPRANRKLIEELKRRKYAPSLFE